MMGMCEYFGRIVDWLVQKWLGIQQPIDGDPDELAALTPARQGEEERKG